MFTDDISWITNRSESLGIISMMLRIPEHLTLSDLPSFCYHRAQDTRMLSVTCNKNNMQMIIDL